MKKNHDETLIFLFLAVLFILLSLLAFFIIQRERGRGNLLLQYEAEKTASALFESFRDTQALEEGELGRRIAGFGIYSLSGYGIINMGTAPDRLSNTDRLSRAAVYEYNREDQTFRLVRRVGILPEMMGPDPDRRGMIMRRGHQNNMPQFLFLEINTAEYWKMERYYRMGLGVIPLFIGLSIVFVGFLYRKNASYRQKLESQQRLVQLGEIARTLAHEIKNPLSAIRIQTGILKKVLPEESHRDLGVIEEEVQRLTLLTDRIGDFLRNPEGTPERIELNRFLESLLSRFDRQVRFTSETKEAVNIVFDRERLRSVFENLIKNALESSDENPDVEVCLAVAKAKVSISVLDRGEGVPPDMNEKIFDPFFTSKTRGSGIGLSIAKRFVEAGRGTLALASRKGGGTEAQVTLAREDH